MVGVIAASHNQDFELAIEDVQMPIFQQLLIHDEVPKHPARVYQGDGIGVFTSEIKFQEKQDIMFASTVLEWFTKGGLKLIIIDGITRSDKELTKELYVCSSSKAVEKTSAKVEPIQQGIVAGITGFLLGEGDCLGIDNGITC